MPPRESSLCHPTGGGTSTRTANGFRSRKSTRSPHARGDRRSTRVDDSHRHAVPSHRWSTWLLLQAPGRPGGRRRRPTEARPQLLGQHLDQGAGAAVTPGAAGGPGSPDGHQERAKAEDHRAEPDQATKDGDQGQNPQDSPADQEGQDPSGRLAEDPPTNDPGRGTVPETRGDSGWISQPSWCIPPWPEEPSRSARPAGHGGDSR